MTWVWVSITLAWYTRHVWSSIWRDACVSAGTLFTELTVVLRRTWTSLHIWRIFCSTFPENQIKIAKTTKPFFSSFAKSRINSGWLNVTSNSSSSAQFAFCINRIQLSLTTPILFPNRLSTTLLVSYDDKLINTFRFQFLRDLYPVKYDGFRVKFIFPV